MAEWYFTSNDGGEVKGINDSGVSTFRGTPLKSLAREICQNSLDAVNNKNEPVIVEFSVYKLPTASFPNADYLKVTFEKCIDFWKNQTAKNTKETFETAIDKISCNEISMMRISDFNTKGLTGSQRIKDINTDWYRLIKSTGSSDKKGPAGGSYGIGKYAPFACSDFLTVIYNTYDIEDNVAYQGVSRLVTFEKENGDTTTGIGYFGNEKTYPVFESIELDPSFKRDVGDYGTDIFITGYKYDNDREPWEDKIITSVLDGFLGAIWKNKLVVKVGDTEISKSTLGELMETYRDDLNDKYVTEYYDVLVSDRTKWFIESNFMGLGEIKFGVLLADTDKEYHRKSAMIRQTGMKIKDADRISTFVQFAAVMFIDGDDINERLREIENPEHTEWQPERSTKQIEAKTLVQSIYKYMRNAVASLAENDNQNEIDVVGVADFIPDIPEESDSKEKEETITDKIFQMEKRILNSKTLSGKTASSTLKSNDDGIGGIEPNNESDYDDWYHNENPQTPPPNPVPKPAGPVKIIDEGNLKINRSVEIKPSQFIPYCLDSDNGKYAILFTPSISGNNGSISLYLSGETENFAAPILSVKTAEGDKISFIDNKIIGLTFDAEVPIRLMIDIDFHDYCSMEVKANADKA